MKPVGPASRAEKREEIVRCTWRLIADQGMRAASMRSLASAAGYANGALAYYFDGKDDLVHAAFAHVVARTEQRMHAAARARTGLAALYAVCDEMLPLDTERRREARIVLPFWEAAQHDRRCAALQRRALHDLAQQLGHAISGAVTSGELRKPTRTQREHLVAQLTAAMLGAQVLAVLSERAYPPRRLRALVRSCLAPWLAR